MAEYPMREAIDTVKQGLSARAGLRAYRAGGGTVTDARWFRMVSQVRDAVAKGNDEPLQPLNERPKSDRITVFETGTGSGYLQNVTVFVKDKESGLVRARPFSIASDFLTTRADAIETALANFVHNKDEYEEEVLFGVYRSTNIMVPGSKL